MDRTIRNNLPIEANEKSPKHRAAAIFLQSLTVSLAFALSLLLVFSFVAYKSGDPDSCIGVLSLAAMYISAMAGGFWVGARLDSSVLSGAICGSLYLLLLILSATLRGGSLGVSVWLALLMYSLVPIAAIAGSLIGSRICRARTKGQKSSARRQRRRR